MDFVDKILDWLDRRTLAKQEFKLRMKSCQSCEILQQELIATRILLEREINKTPAVENIMIEPESEMKPLHRIPARTRMAMAMHDSFKNIENNKKEYDQEQDDDD